jgi:hypothetical protein
MTNGHDAAIAVDVALHTGNLALPDVVGQGKRCLLAATIRTPIRCFAGLSCFRSVYPKQVDALTMNLDRVAIYDRRAASYDGAAGSGDG